MANIQPSPSNFDDGTESVTHSFVVKIWLEEIEPEHGRAIWRGRIIHVVSGNRRYFQDLNGMVLFILPYLEQMGARMDFLWRLKYRLGRFKLNTQRKD